MRKNEPLMSIGEAATVLGVSEASLRQWSDRGRIRASVTPGGHRRYSKVELKKFMSSRRKTIGVKELGAEIQATRNLHGHLGRTFLEANDCCSRLNDAYKSRLADLGRAMLEVTLTYVSGRARRGQTLETARGVGRGFGDALVQLEVPLTDAVKAFMFHKVPIMEAIVRLMGGREAHSGRVAEAIALVPQIMDEAMLSLVAAYQQDAEDACSRRKDFLR